MNIRPCPADRSRALGRLRKGRPVRVRRIKKNVLEVKLICGCEVEVDFNDPELLDPLLEMLKRKLSA